AADVCQAYLSIATTGTATPEQVTLLRRSSPASILDRITAPTLLVQGEADSLFPLSEADANARGIAAHGTPVRVAWFTGGHDGGSGPQSDQDRLKYLTAQWLDHYLLGKGNAPANSFTYSRIAGIDAPPDGLVAPVHLTGLPQNVDQAQPVTVTLPAVVQEFQAGHRIRITVATADQAYLTPATPTVYTVGLGDGGVTLPTVDSTPIATAA